MGILTWVLIAVIILAVIGLGWQTFFSGIIKGFEKVGESAVVKNGTQDAKELAGELAENGSEKISEPEN